MNSVVKDPKESCLQQLVTLYWEIRIMQSVSYELIHFICHVSCITIREQRHTELLENLVRNTMELEVSNFLTIIFCCFECKWKLDFFIYALLLICERKPKLLLRLCHKIFTWNILAGSKSHWLTVNWKNWFCRARNCNQYGRQWD